MIQLVSQVPILVVALVYLKYLDARRARREVKQDAKIDAIARHLGVEFETGVHTVVRHPGVSGRARKAL